MLEDIKKIISQVMSVDLEKVQDDSSPDDIENWDSYNHINMVLAIEEHFKVQILDSKASEMLSVKLIQLTLKEICE